MEVGKKFNIMVLGRSLDLELRSYGEAVLRLYIISRFTRSLRSEQLEK